MTIGGISRPPRMKVSRAMCSRKRKQRPTVITFAITIIQTKDITRSRCLVNIGGPGTSPWIRKAPSRMAMVTLVGTPNATVVTRLPPSFELFAAPGPRTPSIAPLPKRSFPGQLADFLLGNAGSLNRQVHQFGNSEQPNGHRNEANSIPEVELAHGVALGAGLWVQPDRSEHQSDSTGDEPLE